MMTPWPGSEERPVRATDPSGSPVKVTYPNFLGLTTMVWLALAPGEILSILYFSRPLTRSKSSDLKPLSTTLMSLAAVSPTLKRLYLTTMSIPSTRYLLLICFDSNNLAEPSSAFKLTTEIKTRNKILMWCDILDNCNLSLVEVNQAIL